MVVHWRLLHEWICPPTAALHCRLLLEWELIVLAYCGESAAELVVAATIQPSLCCGTRLAVRAWLPSHAAAAAITAQHWLQRRRHLGAHDPRAADRTLQ